MDFKKFLKKFSYLDDCLDVIGNGKPLTVVPIKEIGEWAWKKFLKDLKQVKKINKYKKPLHAMAKEHLPNNPLHLPLGFCIQYIDIAIACLGKKEIQKRVKELKK